MITLNSILSAVKCKMSGEARPEKFSSASIDSRTLTPGQLFFAICGENQDGHDFVPYAFRAGALGAVVSRPVSLPDTTHLLISVSDTLEALKTLSHSIRCEQNPTVIGITGSTGKTTTKEMLAHILSARHSTEKSFASFNNQFGVPLTLLQLGQGCTHVVVEIGASLCGEISELARIAEPDIGIITNIGYAHIENFGSLRGTLREKSELFRNVRKGGTVILNTDDELLRETSGQLRVGAHKLMTVGSSDKNDVYATNLTFSEHGISGRLHHRGKSTPLTLNLVGRQFLGAGLLAAAAAIECGVELDDIGVALSTFDLPPGRLNVRQLTPHLRVIDDTYNASPDAVRAALSTLGDFQSARRIAVLGEMRELGPFNESCHEMIGVEAAKTATHLVVVGESGIFAMNAARRHGLDPNHIFAASSATDALPIVRKLIDAGNEETVILVKGSRFSHMERVVIGLGGVQVTCQLSRCSKYINCKKCPSLEAQ